ncbi:hypothetical protein E2562_011715 [Oryza meyeriana var. granulata]|uniref:Uncharacterized protein n=1 Tax=Oryza meyeriana var. granulata TaxID=110450 RepID=A0A6G1DGT6_9ORYZ|nr:hypothetical protein E2562_011715 [Oryza meyeriana var. granulata]
MSWFEMDAALFTAVLGHDVVHHLATMPSHLDEPETASASSSSAELQARLHDLVEQKGERSMARKRVLLRLHALYGGGDDEGAGYT